MALKKKITKADYDKLKEGVQENYIEDGDGGYKLDLEGEQDNEALKRAKDRETQLRKDAEKKAKELEDKLADIEGDDARKSGDIDLITKSMTAKHQKEIEKLKADFETEKTGLGEQLGKFQAHTKKQLIDNYALQLATELNPKSPKVLLPHIKERLLADFDGDEPVTKILGADGKVSNLTRDQLKSEFVANKDFADYIIGSKASGSAGTKPSGSAFNPNQPETAPDLSKMNPKDLAAHISQVKEQQEQEA